MEQETEVDDFCVNCGVPIDDGKRMCGFCGPYPPVDEEASLYPHPSLTTILVVIGLTIAVLLTLFFV